MGDKVFWNGDGWEVTFTEQKEQEKQPGKPYFEILDDAWRGGWRAGETLRFHYAQLFLTRLSRVSEDTEIVFVED